MGNLIRECWEGVEESYGRGVKEKGYGRKKKKKMSMVFIGREKV